MNRTILERLKYNKKMKSCKLFPSTQAIDYSLKSYSTTGHAKLILFIKASTRNELHFFESLSNIGPTYP